MNIGSVTEIDKTVMGLTARLGMSERTIWTRCPKLDMGPSIAIYP